MNEIGGKHMYMHAGQFEGREGNRPGVVNGFSQKSVRARAKWRMVRWALSALSWGNIDNKGTVEECACDDLLRDTMRLLR